MKVKARRVLTAMTTTAEPLWFDGCPNHVPARELLDEMIDGVAPGTPIIEIDASDPAVAATRRFPGPPTIRINGRDVDPRYEDISDYSLRYRMFWTDSGLSGTPARVWIRDALRGLGAPRWEARMARLDQ